MTAMAQPFRILVADDEQPVLRGYERVLTVRQDVDALEVELFGDKGDRPSLPEYDICYCQQGRDVITAVREACEEDRRFAVAFLDVRMPPGLDGVEVAKRIRALDPLIHIVVVTGFSDLHPAEIARQVPPVEKLYYLTKPFHAAEVQQFALALTGKWQAERTSLGGY